MYGGSRRPKDSLTALRETTESLSLLFLLDGSCARAGLLVSTTWGIAPEGGSRVWSKVFRCLSPFSVALSFCLPARLRDHEGIAASKQLRGDHWVWVRRQLRLLLRLFAQVRCLERQWHVAQGAICSQTLSCMTISSLVRKARTTNGNVTFVPQRLEERLIKGRWGEEMI